MDLSRAFKGKKRNVKTIKGLIILIIPSLVLTNNKINQRIFAAGFKISLILN